MTAKSSTNDQVRKMGKNERASLDSLSKSIMKLTSKIGKTKPPIKGRGQ